MRRRILAGCATAACLFLAAAAAPAKPAPARIAPPVVRASPPPTAAELVGRWGDNGDCTKFIVFRSDGTFLSYSGGEGRWSLARYQLVMRGAARTITVRVERIDRAHLRIFNADGSVGGSQRCAYSSR